MQADMFKKACDKVPKTTDSESMEQLAQEKYSEMCDKVYPNIFKCPIYQEISRFSKLKNDEELKKFVEDNSGRKHLKYLDKSTLINSLSHCFHVLLLLRLILIDIIDGNYNSSVVEIPRSLLYSQKDLHGDSGIINFTSRSGLSNHGEPDWRPFSKKDSRFGQIFEKMNAHLERRCTSDPQSSPPAVQEITGYPGIGKSITAFWYSLIWSENEGTMIWCHVKSSDADTLQADAQSDDRLCHIMVLFQPIEEQTNAEEKDDLKYVFSFCKILFNNDVKEMLSISSKKQFIPIMFDGRFPNNLIPLEYPIHKGFKIMSHRVPDIGVGRKAGKTDSTLFLNNWLEEDYHEALKVENVAKLFWETNQKEIMSSIDDIQTTYGATRDFKDNWQEKIENLKAASGDETRNKEEAPALFYNLIEQSALIKDEVIADKYYYAGGSCRFFLVRGNQGVIDDITKSLVNFNNPNSNHNVSTLFARYEEDLRKANCEVPVSHYALDRFTEAEVDEEFYANGYKVALDTKDRTTQGQMFEAYIKARIRNNPKKGVNFITIIEDKLRSGLKVRKQGSPINFGRKSRFVTYEKHKEEEVFGLQSFKLRFWAWPDDQKNPGFDFVHVDLPESDPSSEEETPESEQSSEEETPESEQSSEATLLAESLEETPAAGCSDETSIPVPSGKVRLFQATISPTHDVLLYRLPHILDGLRHFKANEDVIDVEFFFVSPYDEPPPADVQCGSTVSVPTMLGNEDKYKKHFTLCNGKIDEWHLREKFKNVFIEVDTPSIAKSISGWLMASLKKKRKWPEERKTEESLPPKKVGKKTPSSDGSKNRKPIGGFGKKTPSGAPPSGAPPGSPQKTPKASGSAKSTSPVKTRSMRAKENKSTTGGRPPWRN